MTSPLNIVWFKRDLRIVDHRPLVRALEAGPVLPLYIVEPKLWGQPDASGRQWAVAAESINELQKALAVDGSPQSPFSPLASRKLLQKLTRHQPRF